jgi:AraC family transcriptional regulator, regulatory protein of adaptative response / methylated-DNA-[protein]-cysteine methyltransferase
MDTNRGYLKYPLGHEGSGELRIAEASYRAHGQGAQMSYVVVDSTVGQLMIAATEHGLSWLGVHESPSYLESELRRDYPLAEVRGGDGVTDTLAARILDHLRDGTRLEIPLDIRATSFQAAVWSELCAIASGTTRSYSEIARRIGRPSASRAVGHANGSNPIAILIPCHRAIGADGSLTGYRWGLEYKRRLLAREGAKVRLEASLAGQDPLPFW